MNLTNSRRDNTELCKIRISWKANKEQVKLVRVPNSNNHRYEHSMGLTRKPNNIIAMYTRNLKSLNLTQQALL